MTCRFDIDTLHYPATVSGLVPTLQFPIWAEEDRSAFSQIHLGSASAGLFGLILEALNSERVLCSRNQDCNRYGTVKSLVSLTRASTTLVSFEVSRNTAN